MTFIHDNSFPVTVTQDEFENLYSEFCLIIEALECKSRAVEWYPQDANECVTDSSRNSLLSNKARSRKVTSVRRVLIKLWGKSIRFIMLSSVVTVCVGSAVSYYRCMAGPSASFEGVASSVRKLSCPQGVWRSIYLLRLADAPVQSLFSKAPRLTCCI